MANLHGESPRESVDRLVRERGLDDLVRACRAVLRSGEVDAALLIGLAGRHAERVLTGAEGGVEGYWPRVWVLRAFLYAWADVAGAEVCAATHDESWRVREMALKVIRHRRLDEGVPEALRLRNDAVPRVRAAAERALSVPGGGE